MSLRDFSDDGKLFCTCSYNYIDIGSLPYLQEELFDLRSKWYDIGVQINIENGTLQNIRSQFSDNGDGLRELLTHWLKGTPVWEDLFKALRSRPVGAHDTATKLQREMDQRFSDSIPEGIHHNNYITMITLVFN